MLGFDLLPLTQVAKPRGPWSRSTLYRWDKERPGLLRRLPGVRGTLVHQPTLRQIEANATPLRAPAATGDDRGT